MTNPDIDDLFKRGSERYEFSYRPDAWEQMDQLLVQQEQGRRRRRLLILLLFLLVAAAGTGTWLLWPTPSAEEAPATEEQIYASDSASSSDQALESEAITNAPSNNNSSTSKDLSPSPEIESNSPSSKNQNTVSAPPKPLQQNKVVTVNQIEKSVDTENTATEIGEGMSYALPKLSLLPELPTLYFYPVPIGLPMEITPAGNPAVPEELVKRLVQTKPPITVSLFTALEWNSVGFLDEARQGWKVGFQLEHPIGQKFSLGVGFAYTKKDYIAGEGEYTVKEEGFWVDGVKPKSTKADCNVFEVPLNVQYYSRGTAETGWWASVGLHSYFMNREQFEFNYAETPVGAVMNWEERNSHRHFLSASQLSFGYQKRISNRFIWQIAPYVQIPLAKMGHGKVNLYSFGLQSNFKFTTR